ncbi:MAG: prolipoprotein diacylglyceryl transferase family protein, partial [Candidatus Thermoplasmatota archaeon]|nr:prolipoprotein diacylglyceryl transferase family protein [Candidatus Thermoplasmatota archaeon]
GAIIGAKILAWVQHPQTTILIATNEPALLLGGKTIVGGLLGGMAGIELAKKAMGITKRTGDVLVMPLLLGMTLGRIGCFLSGLEDATYGIETSLPWGIDLGDGVSRHPTALYEIVAIWLIYFGIQYRSNTSIVPSGWQFRTFLMSYLVWRIFVDWIKPADWELIFLSPIQIACILGLTWYMTLGVLTEDEWATAHSSSHEAHSVVEE